MWLPSPLNQWNWLIQLHMTKPESFIRHFSTPLSFHFLPPCLSWRPRSIVITSGLFLANFHLILVVPFSVTSLRWLFGWIGKHLKILFNCHNSLFSGLDKFIMSKWMLQQSLYLYCITHEYIIVCPPLLLRCQLLPSIIPSLPTC